MVIQITDKYRIFHDGYNWRVSEYRESTEIPFGKHKGQMTEPKWVDLERFYPHAEMALKWILTQDIFLSNDDWVTIEEFKDYLEKFYSRVKEDMRMKLESGTES